ncbi:glutamate 5-kinase [Candidatus Omnitrophota bacterium]
MKQSGRNYKRIVIKIGSSLLCADGVTPDVGVLQKICAQVSKLAQEGKEVVIVSSGAIAFGLHLLGLRSRPGELNKLQAASAVGQNQLMENYRRFFAKGVKSAQVLLTREDFNDRRRFLNAKNTLLELLKYKCVPVINENDAVSTEEIRFGDNDRLSALVASLIAADLLIILSDVDGLLDKQRQVIRVVEEITSQIKALACPTKKMACAGGMITKLEAAKIAGDAGIPCVIANGHKKDVLLSLAKEPEKKGTLFIHKKGLTAKRHWIAFGTKAKGKIIVDDGAKRALMNKKSLLSVGVVDCEGGFESGDIVGVTDIKKREFARGKASISAAQLKKVRGQRFAKEIIHRDNIVILEEG